MKFLKIKKSFYTLCMFPTKKNVNLQSKKAERDRVVNLV